MNHAQQIQLKSSRYPMDTYPDEDKVTIDPVKLLGLPLKIHEMLRRPVSSSDSQEVLFHVLIFMQIR